MVQPVMHSLISADVGGFKPLVDYPGDNCCFLYENHNFDHGGNRLPSSDVTARRLQICHTGSRTVINTHDLGWGNRASSYICGKNVWYDFCRDGVGRDCHNGDLRNSGAGYVRNHAIRHMDNRLSTAILGPYDPREIGAVTLFEDALCSGASARFYWDPESSSSGTFYNEEDLYFGGFRNNHMESFLVPKGYSVEFYDGHGFYGSRQIAEGGFLNDDDEMRCMSANFPDAVSSLIVKR